MKTEEFIALAAVALAAFLAGAHWSAKRMQAVQQQQSSVDPSMTWFQNWGGRL